MASNRVRRIQKEIKETASDIHSKVFIEIGENGDVDNLEGTFLGPPDTPYEGGTFCISITIPTDYPFRPPKMKFKTRIWHPNVSSQTGAICLDTLSSNWSPVLTIKSALISIQGLLASPEPKDPQDAEVASMLLKNPKEFERIAREWSVKYAGAPAQLLKQNNENERKAQESSSRSQKEKAASGVERYHGYNPDLIERFCAMGFDVEKVVSAFEFVGVERNGGLDYELEEEYMGDITARLFGEP